MMPQKMQLQINEPCNENWNKMTVSQQGRFCNACQKVVIDFTEMSDEKLLAYFKNYDGNICGRFEDEQLNRPLLKHYQTKPSWQRWTFTVLFTGLLLVNKAKAQGKVILTEHVSTKKLTISQMGGLQIINGKVLDQNGKGVPYASILVKNENWGTATDSLGNFRLSIKTGLRFVELKISSVGYVSKLIKKDLAKAENEIIVLNPQDLLDDVVITGYGTIRCRTLTGGVSATKLEQRNLDTFVNKEMVITKKLDNTFKIYPNPAKAGSTIILQFTEPMNYQLKLLNMNGQVLSVQNIILGERYQTINYVVPAQLSAGEYFLQVVGASQLPIMNKLIIVH